MDIEQLKTKVLEGIKGYWKEVYDAAPEGAKEYYRVNFALSSLALSDGGMDNVPQQLHDELYDIYHKMDDECWRYILDKTSGPSKLGLGQIWKKIRASQSASSSPETAAATPQA